MKAYKTSRNRSAIEEVELTRMSDKSVFYLSASRKGEVREARFSDWSHYHATEAEAVAYLIDRLEGAVFSAQAALVRAENELKKFRAERRLA